MKKIKYIIFILLLLININVYATTGTYHFDDEHYTNYYYEDNYFDNYDNEHLRTFALLLANSSFDSDTNSVNDIMTNIGLNNIKISDRDNEKLNTCMYAIGTKKINNTNLIVVNINGYASINGWISNFMIGESGNATGFDEASKDVIEGLKNYIKTNNLTNNKIFVTGYSRGGAISNLVGVYLNEHIDEFDTTTNDLFIYTFEAPNSSSSKKTYDNIHNIVNYNDIVVNILPNNYGLYSNGVVLDITTDKTMLSKSYHFLDLEFKNYKLVNKKKFIQDCIEKLSNMEINGKKVLTRENYYSIEDDIKNLYNILLSKTEDQIYEIIELFSSSIEEYMNIPENDALAKLNTLMGTDTEKIFDVYREIIDVVDEKVKNTDAITQTEYNLLKTSCYNIILVLQPIITYDLKYQEDDTTYMLYHLGTLMLNFEEIISEHYEIVIFNLLKDMDSNYDSDSSNTGGVYVNGNRSKTSVMEERYNLSQSDVESVNKGANLSIKTVIENVNVENISEEDKVLLEDADTGDIIKVLDITIEKNIDDTTENISYTNEDITINIRLSNSEYDSSKYYKVVKIHNGKLTELDTKVRSYNDLSDEEKEEVKGNLSIDELKKSKFISFKTNEFSTFILTTSSKPPYVLIAIGCILLLAFAIRLSKRKVRIA